MKSFYEVLQTPVMLISDYEDYYDAYFQDEQCQNMFLRLFGDETLKSDRLKILRGWNLKVIPWATGEKMFGCLPANACDIVDETRLVADCLFMLFPVGEEKKLYRTSLPTAAEDFAHIEGSLYIPTSEKGSISFTHVRVGVREYWLKYTSQHPWDSHVDPVIELLSSPPAGAPVMEETKLTFFPMHAIDFVCSENNVFYAINYHPSIKISNLPIKEVLSSEDAAWEIKNWLLTGEALEKVMKEAFKELELVKEVLK